MSSRLVVFHRGRAASVPPSPEERTKGQEAASPGLTSLAQSRVPLSTPPSRTASRYSGERVVSRETKVLVPVLPASVALASFAC